MQEALPDGGCLYLDRPLPFLCVNGQLYGEVGPGLLELAKGHLDAGAFAQGAGLEHAPYRQACVDFSETMQIRDGIAAGLMVSRGQLLIGQDTKVPASRVDALLQHEVGTHYNGRAQPLRPSARGWPATRRHYEGRATGLAQGHTGRRQGPP